MPDRSAAAAAGRAEEDAEDDYITSPPGLWLPRTVVKRHRKKATIIWISLLAVFSAYVAYIVLETVKARTSPSTSVEVKQKHFKFPDVGVCLNFLEGCLSPGLNCIAGFDLFMTAQLGFMEIPHQFNLSDYPEVATVREAFPGCPVMPLSRLTVNETAVNNGDVKSFTVSFSLIWVEDPLGQYNATEYPVNTQSVAFHFIDLDQDVDQIGKSIAEVYLPYERVNFTQGEWTLATENYLLLSLSEFSGITKTGARLKVEKTFRQSTTSATYNWLWPTPSIPFEVAFLEITMTIPKFEFTRIEEVDPVDVWTIIGAIGGGWQLVVLAFGIFVVFSEKQPPNMKMRKFYKTATMSITTVDQRLSGTRSRPPQQDTELDETNEGLPTEWVKMQQQEGRVYDFNAMADSTRVSSPNELDQANESTSAPSATPPRPSATCTSSRGANVGQAAGFSTWQEAAYGTSNGRDRNGGHHLPPGWVARTNGEGRAYYTDADRKITHWERPAWCAHPTGDINVQIADTPMGHTSRGSNPSSTQIINRITELPSTASRYRTFNPSMDVPFAASGPSETTAEGVVDEHLPPIL